MRYYSCKCTNYNYHHRVLIIGLTNIQRIEDKYSHKQYYDIIILCTDI
jgi:hypothetical protein